MMAACFILDGDGILSVDDMLMDDVGLHHCALLSSGFPTDSGSLLDVGITFHDLCLLDYGIPLYLYIA